MNIENIFDDIKFLSQKMITDFINLDLKIFYKIFNNYYKQRKDALEFLKIACQYAIGYLINRI